jgi:hypothetical protein
VPADLMATFIKKSEKSKKKYHIFAKLSIIRILEYVGASGACIKSPAGN